MILSGECAGFCVHRNGWTSDFRGYRLSTTTWPKSSSRRENFGNRNWPSSTGISTFCRDLLLTANGRELIVPFSRNHSHSRSQIIVESVSACMHGRSTLHFPPPIDDGPHPFCFNFTVQFGAYRSRGTEGRDPPQNMERMGHWQYPPPP